MFSISYREPHFALLIGVIVSLHRFLAERYGENLRTVTIIPISETGFCAVDSRSGAKRRGETSPSKKVELQIRGVPADGLSAVSALVTL